MPATPELRAAVRQTRFTRSVRQRYLELIKLLVQHINDPELERDVDDALYVDGDAPEEE